MCVKNLKQCQVHRNGFYVFNYYMLLLLSRFSRVQLCATPVPGILQARTLEWVAISYFVPKTRPVLGKQME